MCFVPLTRPSVVTRTECWEGDGRGMNPARRAVILRNLRKHRFANKSRGMLRYTRRSR